MKLFNTAAAMLMLAMSVLLSNGAMAQSTEPEANCSVLYTDSAVEVGAVCVTVNQDDENVFLDYLLIDEWKLSEANAWIGDNANNLPIDGSGNPQVSVFPHSAINLVDVNQHSFVIPFTELSIDAGTFCSADVIVAASAVVTRTIAGEPDGGGKSDKSNKSGKSGKSGKSDKSGQSDKSDKSDKSGKSGKGSKCSKSDKSDKNSKASKGSKGGKGNSSSAKNGKGSSHNGSSSWASNGKSDKSGKSGQSAKSGKSGHSGKSGKSGGHNGGGTDPVTETFTAWAGDNLVGNGSYFSFSNDFCGPEEPPLITLPNTSCYNVYASLFNGAPSTFSPVGFADPALGVLNTVTAVGGQAGLFVNANNVAVSNFLMQFTAPGTLQLLASTPPGFGLAKLNIFAGAAGSFSNVSPLSYGTSLTGPIVPGQIVNLPAPLPLSANFVIHGIMCPGAGPYE